MKQATRLVELTVAAALGLALLGGPPAGAAADEATGVILMHGKGGTSKPRSPVGRLAAALEDAGFLVMAPDMPWSRSRIWDRDHAGAMAEIDGYVEELKGKGAGKIVIGGHSLGANAALGYGARRAGLAGILAIAPGHVPEIKEFQKRTGFDYKRARAMVGKGQGEKTADFKDFNQGRRSEVRAKAKDYLSWYAPDGPAVMPRNAAQLKPGTPLLWIIGKKDVMFRIRGGAGYAFARAPAHPKSRYAVVPGGHRVTPQKGEDEIIAWLGGL